MDITWQMLDSGSAIRDGIISGDIQVASMGTAPFLVGLDAGVEWKTLMSMNDMNLQLVTMDKGAESLEDLPDGAKIAMPAPDSIQSVVLRKGAEEQLGDATALDKSIVALGHPDGVQALVSGQIDAHLTVAAVPGPGDRGGRARDPRQLRPVRRALLQQPLHDRRVRGRQRRASSTRSPPRSTMPPRC